MRVLQVTPYFAPAFRYGGPPRSVLGLCKGLQNAGVDVEVVTTTANGDAELPASRGRADSYDGVPVHYAPSAFPKRFFGARLASPLASALARVDLCHVHGIWNVPEWRATRMARGRGMPYVVSPRGMLQAGSLQQHWIRKQVGYRLVERAALSNASLLHATSDAEALAITRFALRAPVVVVPNGVDAGAATRASHGFRARHGIPIDAFVVVFLGRIHPIKRLDLLVDAFQSVHGQDPHARLVIAGPDEGGLDALRAQLAAIRDAVHVVGPVDDEGKWSMLREANVSVQCSDSESFGLATVEAMAAGLPVVVTRTCPWPQIEEQRAGLWVEQSVTAVAAAIAALIARPGEAAAMGQRGAAYVRRSFSWDAIGHAMAQHYRAIVGEQRHRIA